MATSSGPVSKASKKEARVSICESGPDRVIVESRAEIWLQENMDALNSSNDYVERNGLPLAKYRQV